MKTLLFTLSLLAMTMTKAQSFDQSKIIFEGRITELFFDRPTEKSLYQATVEVWSNDQLLNQWKSNKQGRFRIETPYRGTYTVVFKKEGYITKSIQVDASNLKNEELALQVLVQADMILFQESEGLDFSFLQNKPVAKATIGKRNHATKWDDKYNELIQEQIQSELKKLANNEASL
ncbi:MAG: hypothetical protein ACKO5Y_04100 [Bacteroidota bacterium]